MRFRRLLSNDPSLPGCAERAIVNVPRRRPAGAVAALLALSILLLAGCGEEPAATNDDRPLVVTSVPIIYSLVANVAGEEVRVEEILPPGVTPHDVTFTPDQVKLVAGADLLVENGAGLEAGWLDKLVSAAENPDLVRVVASDGVDYLKPMEATPIPDSGAEEGEEEQGNVDPHVWLDPNNAKLMVRNITEGLKRIDPDGASGYERRAEEFSRSLAELDAEIEAELADLPSRDFISFHSAFGYYARAYDLRQVAVIEEFPGKEPSARYLTALIDLVKTSGVRAVFSEPQFSSRPAETLARETGARVYEVDPEGSKLSAVLYEELMRSNTATFKKALGGGE
jgi:ABC-type Zn uptake system ZnuABC Zn-binding protein ZnuA